MLVSRRSLIIGAASSLLAAPALVKVTSLMPLRGYDMDPWIIGYFPTGHKGICSFYNFKSLLESDLGSGTASKSLDVKIQMLNESRSYIQFHQWKKVRLSEVNKPLSWTFGINGMENTAGDL
jgi:hypothetical protein